MNIEQFFAVKAYAKINLCLDITGIRDNGYHDVRMIMQSLELHDDIYIERKPKGEAELRVEDRRKGALSAIPEDGRNLMCRAAEDMIRRFGINGSVRMKLVKRIPSEAGLGGGSADAAAVIQGINELFGLELTRAELMDTGASLGADVPFCIAGGTALSEGIGELLSPVDSKLSYNVLIVKPLEGLSTPLIYREFDRLGTDMLRPDTDAAVQALRDGNGDLLCKNVINVLEYAAVRKLPMINDIRSALLDNGAAAARMTGSGSAVFGLFENEEGMRNAAAGIKTAEFASKLADIIETKMIKPELF